jgi:hypothetical protein
MSSSTVVDPMVAVSMVADSTVVGAAAGGDNG